MEIKKAIKKLEGLKTLRLSVNIKGYYQCCNIPSEYIEATETLINSYKSLKTEYDRRFFAMNKQLIKMDFIAKQVLREKIKELQSIYKKVRAKNKVGLAMEYLKQIELLEKLLESEDK